MSEQRPPYKTGNPEVDAEHPPRERLVEILEWVKQRSAPNHRRAYSRCTICGATWWDDSEFHDLDCWVPRLKKEVRGAE